MGAGCFSSRVYLPVEEIDRPLSLPPASGTVGLELDGWVRSDDHRVRNHQFIPTLLPPYFKIGNNSECYIPGLFRRHVLKNIEIDGTTKRITGPNAALTAGMNYAGYSRLIGFEFEFCAGYDYKRPLNEKVWITSGGYLYYTTNISAFSGFVDAGVGYQISRHFYATLNPTLSFLNPWAGSLIVYPEDEQYFSLPLTVGVNINRAVKLYWRSSIHYYGDFSVVYGQALGLSYTW
jgi:hypothetical protein